MASLRIGLLGCGRIARLVHIGVLRDLPGVELAALAESDAERRAAASRLVPAASAVADYRELPGRADLDALVICLPPALHAEAACAAFESGKHVYLEKPLATSVSEAERVLAAWRGSGRVGAIGFNYRYHPLYAEAREAIRSGRLGALVAVRTVFSSAGEQLPQWKRKRESGGGVLLDLASHHIDLVEYVLGRRIDGVCVEMRSHATESDTAFARFTLGDGLVADSFFSLASVDDDRFEIYGTQAMMSLDRHRDVRARIRPARQELSRLETIGREAGALLRPRLWGKLRAPRAEPSYRAALAAFVAEAGGAQKSRCQLALGYRNLQIVEAAERSAGGFIDVGAAADKQPGQP